MSSQGGSIAGAMRRKQFSVHPIFCQCLFYPPTQCLGGDRYVEGTDRKEELGSRGWTQTFRGRKPHTVFDYQKMAGSEPAGILGAVMF